MELGFSSEGAFLTTFITEGGRKVIYPMHDLPNNKRRGGLFLCAPNFGPGHFPGQVQHGTWRQDSQQMCIAGKTGAVFMGDVSTKSGSAKVSLQYVAAEQALTIRTTVKALGLIPMSLGLHPYFWVPEGKPYAVVVSTDNKASTIRSCDQKEGNGEKFLCTDVCSSEFITTHASLSYMNGTIAITSSVTNLPCVMMGWVVWTDDKKKYICIEPIIVGHQTTGKIEPLWLNKGSLLEWVVQISVVR